jgi:hypothetical protein
MRDCIKGKDHCDCFHDGLKACCYCYAKEEDTVMPEASITHNEVMGLVHGIEDSIAAHIGDSFGIRPKVAKLKESLVNAEIANQQLAGELVSFGRHVNTHIKMLAASLQGKEKEEPVAGVVIDGDDDEELADEDQMTVGDWAKDTFPGFMGAKNRSLLIVEAVVSLAIISGCTPVEVGRAFQFSMMRWLKQGYSPTIAELAVQERAANLMTELMIFAHDQRFDLIEHMNLLMMESRRIPKEELRAALKEKIEQGLPLVEEVKG